MSTPVPRRSHEYVDVADLDRHDVSRIWEGVDQYDRAIVQAEEIKCIFREDR